EDGIRDFHVTGVQTCALPILLRTQTRMRVLVLARRRVPARIRLLNRKRARAATPLRAEAVMAILLRTVPPDPAKFLGLPAGRKQPARSGANRCVPGSGPYSYSWQLSRLPLCCASTAVMW